MRFNGTKLIGTVVAAALMCGVVATVSAQPTQSVDTTANSSASQQISTASTQETGKLNDVQNPDNGKNSVTAQTSKNEASQDAPKLEQKAPTLGSTAKDSNAANTKSSAAPAPSTQDDQPANNQQPTNSQQPATVGPQEVLPTTATCKPFRGGNAAESSAYGSWTLGMKDGQCTLEVTATDPANEYQFTVIPSHLDDSRMYVYAQPFIEHVIFDGVGKVKLPVSSSGYFSHMGKLRSIDGFDHLDTSAVTNMVDMFSAISIPSLDLSNFDTRNVTNMSGMFYGISATSIRFGPSFVTNKVTDMSNMFARAGSLTSLDLSGFDTSNVEDMSYMFHVAEDLSTLKLGANFKTSKVRYTSGMFMFCEKLQSLDVSHFDTQNVTDMSDMFEYCFKLPYLDVSHFDTHNVVNMSNMFQDCSGLTSLDLTSFDTRQVGSTTSSVALWDNSDMSGMFQDCLNLQSLKFGQKFQTGNVRNMGSMFSGCEKLTSLDVSGFDTRNVINMSDMFSVCEKLTSLDVSHFNTRNVTDMTSMFMSDSALTSLDLRSFNMRKVTKVRYMLTIGETYPDKLFNLRELKLGDDVVLPTPASTGNMWTDIFLENPSLTDATWVRVADVNGASVPKGDLSKQYTSLDVEHRTQGSDPSRSGTYVRSDATKLSVDMNAAGDKNWGTVSDPQTSVGHFEFVQNAQGQDEWQMQFGKLKAPDETALKVNKDANFAANSPKYFKFNGWNTKKDGTGTSYVAGQEVPMNTDVTLYAQWKRIGTPGVSMDLHAKYVLNFKMNSPAGSGAREPASPDKTTSVVKLDSPADITKPRDIKIDHQAYPDIDGYRFDGWTMNGDTKVYKPGDSVSVVPGVTELKGHWTKVYTYSLKFNANAFKGVTGSMPEIDPVGPTTDASHTFTVPANGFTRAGWHFNGWNTKADGSGQSPMSADGVDTLTLNSDKPAVTLYAQWVPEYAYSLSFVSGLPEGTASKAFEPVKGETTTAKSSTLKILTGDKYYREDNQRWQFTGWSDGMGHTYQPGDTVNLTNANPHVVLTGQWVRIYNYNLRFQPTSKNDKAKVSRSFATVAGGITTDGTKAMTIPAKYELKLDESGRYMFSGWKDKDGNAYKPGDHIVLKGDNPDVTLYGAWKLVPVAPSVPSAPTNVAPSVPSAVAAPSAPVASVVPSTPAIPVVPSAVAPVVPSTPAAGVPSAPAAASAPVVPSAPAAASVSSAPSARAAASAPAAASASARPRSLAGLRTMPSYGVSPRSTTVAPQVGHDGTQSVPQTPAPKDWRNVECRTSGAAYVVNLAGYRVMASGNVCAASKPAASVASDQHANAPVWLWIIAAAAVAFICAIYVKRNRSIEAQHRANERLD